MAITENSYFKATRNIVIVLVLGLCLAMYGLSRILPHGVGNIFPREWDIPFILMYLAGWLIQLALPVIFMIFGATNLWDKGWHDISHDVVPIVIWLLTYEAAAIMPWVFFTIYGSWQTLTVPILLLNLFQAVMIVEATIIFLASLILPKKATPAA